MDRMRLGRAGEQAAFEYLKKEKGLVFVTKNWRCGHREIDLIFETKDFLRIVEVRTLSSSKNIQPYETINYEKQKQVISAARTFVKRYNVTKEIVFDVVSVVNREGSFCIEYIKNAYSPRW